MAWEAEWARSPAEDGRFIVEGLAPGDYLLRAQPILSGALTASRSGPCCVVVDGRDDPRCEGSSLAGPHYGVAGRCRQRGRDRASTRADRLTEARAMTPRQRRLTRPHEAQGPVPGRELLS